MTGRDRADGSPKQRRQIFAVGRGQYENIGDVLLRRPLLDWVREAGRLHVYVGHSPDGYDAGLGLRSDDVVYRSFARWYLALLRAAVAGRADSVYKPGEVQLTLIGMKEHVVMLPAVALVRARGGRVARIGAGARNFARLPRAIMWPSSALSNYTRWRDDHTARYLGFGSSMPDLGYSDGLSDDLLRASAVAPSDDRDLLVVSLREDDEVAPRPYPDSAWIEGIREAAKRLGLRIAVATQVSVDDERTRRLAVDLDAHEIVDWPVLAGHLDQEQRLRALYRRARIVASDRLHVIIAGYTEGAVPVGLQLDDSLKISRHFDTIGVHDISINTIGLSPSELAMRIVMVDERRADILEALPHARTRLLGVKEDLHRLLRRAGSGRPDAERAAPDQHGARGRQSRPIVYHVGRAGDVPGGMTQVINAYLGWAFEGCDVDVIVSRGNPGDHVTGVRHLLAARTRIAEIARSRRPAVIVVHLSERGSFLREGHLAAFAARLGLPVIAHLHGSEFARYEREHSATVAKVLGVCAHVIALSEETRSIAAGLVGADLVSLLPNAIPVADPVEKQKTVVFGGVVSYRKGIDVLQEAWRRLALRHEDWTLLIAGPVRDAQLVDDCLTRATFLGSVSHEHLMRLLDEASVAVLPSRDEAMPMFILEAMARGTSVVSTSVGGIPAVLGGGHGVVVAPDDVDALVVGLEGLMSDAERRDRIASRAHERFISHYSAEAVFPNVERVWLSPLGALPDLVDHPPHG
ncbi:glycosyltransferase family 4 protein [Microbacterium sp. Gd 4-13]|uniref:glycosyltransferase family 4 protein n=1 Tax=Microbacterium sp. Gd 4-13 TaxID=2173179 RepID=UPI00105815CC|nr:glycosyltransferase family 4 protein [Microbacterium sp. Gd 4-13]